MTISRITIHLRTEAPAVGPTTNTGTGMDHAVMSGTRNGNAVEVRQIQGLLYSFSGIFFKLNFDCVSGVLKADSTIMPALYQLQY
jgi:hypothetical protein